MRRFLVTMHAGLPISETIHLRPSFSATAAVVPEPEKKSATIASSLLLVD